jgi:D-glycero-D-manno-heptose 1,7-bisphosphate phosphatase
VSREASRQNRLILFDRDGTLNLPVDRYVLRPSELELLPGAGEAVALANRIASVAVVTNQRGVGRGLLSAAGLVAVHDELQRKLALAGGHLDAIYVCPHLAGTCDCRKPLDGLFRQALDGHPEVTPVGCAVIGDQPSDLVPALGLGMAAFMVAGPEGAHRAPDGAVVVASALDAVRMLASGRGWRQS